MADTHSCVAHANLVLLWLLLFCFCFWLWPVVAQQPQQPQEGAVIEGTIAFSTFARPHFGFNVYTVALPSDVLSLQNNSSSSSLQETRVTYGESVSYNAQLVSSSLVSATVLNTLAAHGFRNLLKEEKKENEDAQLLVYVSEEEGSPHVYIDIPLGGGRGAGGEGSRIAASQVDNNQGIRRTIKEEETAMPPPFKLRTLRSGPSAFLNDRPPLTGDVIVYVSTEEPANRPRQSWNGIYSTSFSTLVTTRLSPHGVSDFSPSVSPSGEWVMVASTQGRDWDGEVWNLDPDLYIFRAEDGLQRRLVLRNGGWPSWADSSTVFFHRVAEDGWWSIFKVNPFDVSPDKEPERVTPPGVHAFTPAASHTGKWIAVATRRTSYRHVEIFDLQTKQFVKLTELFDPYVNYYNPFISSSSGELRYHRCRGSQSDGSSTPVVDLRVESVTSPLQDLSLLRIDGSFPAFSPDGSLIAYVDSSNDSAAMHVMKLDGSENRKVFAGNVFGLAWDPVRTGVVYAAHGPVFKSRHAVQIVAIYNADTADVDVDQASSSWKNLTKEGTHNNAFPSPSPDGNYIVFRSGRSGHKNLYIMDAVDGEQKYLFRLTDGNWTDTHPWWSPDNEWIAFSSDRGHPERFALYLVHPNGTGLHKVLNSSLGFINHPVFSPDAKSLVFTTDYAGLSAEPISLPFQYQPYGDIFISQIDGSGLTRITHSSNENGTPGWGRVPVATSALSKEGTTASCKFKDVDFLERIGAAPQMCGFW
ncbi:hypothetical protein CY35_17G078700 [Sphagnum magellanicum]|nr:hypothetical protein CY35_17G078700 [Sphagnum magellanicum]